MKISHLADKARCLVMAAGLALMASFAGTAAQADPLKIDPATQAQALVDAQTLITAGKIHCEPVAANVYPKLPLTKDGKKVDGFMYEVACKTGPGFLAVAFSPTEVSQAVTCIQSAEPPKDPKQNTTTCSLPENTPPYKWLTPVVQTYLPGCVVSNARVMGSTMSTAAADVPRVDRYEVACGTSVGGVLDYPQLSSDAQPNFLSCLMVVDTKLPCTLSTAEQATTALKPVAAQADADCQVTKVRWVGITKESDGYFYEFGCANKPGFMVLTGLDNSFKRSISCASAAGLGGCQYTDAGVAAANANDTYTQHLKTAGYTCSVEDYNVVGTQEQTKRDYIEFKCPEQPFGLIGFVPQEGSTSSYKLNDCFHDQVGQQACTLVTPAILMTQVDKLIKAAEPTKDCDVTQVRYIGETSTYEDGVVAEIACANKRGYIVTLKADRQSLAEKALPCVVARAHKEYEQCTIPGNGTYTGAE